MSKTPQRPRQEKIDGDSQHMWYYESRFDEITVENGILSYRTPVGEGPETILRAIVPCAARQEILDLANKSRLGSHFGVPKIVE